MRHDRNQIPRCSCSSTNVERAVVDRSAGTDRKAIEGHVHVTETREKQICPKVWLAQHSTRASILVTMLANEKKSAQHVV